jgi:hypothetical protein
MSSDVTAAVCTITEQLTKNIVRAIKDALLGMAKAVDAVMHRPVVEVGRQIGP